MPKASRYKRYSREGVSFVFKYEPDDSGLLHIYVRHLKEPADAIVVWFLAQHSWNAEHDRFEGVHEGVGIHWFWINEAERVVMISSCFDA